MEALEFQVFEWFQLPVTSAEWNGFGFDAGRHVKPMVSAGLGVDLSGFNHFILVIDKEDAHLAALAPDGVHVHMSGQDMDPALICHELGHIYGAGHANLDSPGGPIEYGNNFCIMGGEGSKFSFTDGSLSAPEVPSGQNLSRFATSGPGMSAPTVLATGWIDFDDPSVAVDITDQLNSGGPFEIKLGALHGAPRVRSSRAAGGGVSLSGPAVSC